MPPEVPFFAEITVFFTVATPLPQANTPAPPSASVEISVFSIVSVPPVTSAAAPTP